MRRMLAGLLVAVGLSGAAARAETWGAVAADAPYLARSCGARLQFPPGWSTHSTPGESGLLATRDGEMLQQIYLKFRTHARAFRKSKLQSSPTLMPQELAERFVAETRARYDATKIVEQLEVLRNEPDELDRRPAFRLEIGYRLKVDEDTVRYREIIVATALDDGLCIVGFAAPVIHYFARDLATFETSLRSFSFVSGPGGARPR